MANEPSEDATKAGFPDVNVARELLSMSEIPNSGDGLDAPTIYADMVRGAFVSGGIAKFNLFQVRMDLANQELKAVPTATITLPSDQLRAWGDFLIRLAEQNELSPPDVE